MSDMKLLTGVWNIGSIWTMITGTAMAMVYMFTTFVSVDDNDAYHAQQTSQTIEFRNSIYYDQYYSLLERYQQALAAHNDQYAEELKRQMERVRAKICAEDSEWERCLI